MELRIIDARLKTVRVLVQRRQSVGSHKVMWNLKDQEGHKVSPDIYRCVFQVDGFESYGNIQVESIEPTCSEPSYYKSFADAHWNRDLYAVWRDYMSTTAEGEGLLFELPPDKSEEHYAVIGRYDQFVFGWDDASPSLRFLQEKGLLQESTLTQDVASVNRDTYSQLWKNCH